MNALLLLICATIGIDASVREVAVPKDPGKLVTPLHFGVNAEFSRPGIFTGTLPTSDPRSQAERFTSALRESGIRTLRLPGGDGSYVYLPEGRSLTMDLSHASNLWEFRDDNPASRDFVTLENLARFARERQIGLIYQLPMLFHLDQGRSRAAIRSAFSADAKNYDQDRVDAQAEYAVSIAKRLGELQAPVVAWELGNEEYGHCGGTDYGRVAAAIVPRLRQLDADTPIVAVGMGDTWLAECIAELRRQGVLEQIQSFNVHYPFGTWPGPASPSDLANPLLFAQGDLQFSRWFDAATTQRTELGIPNSSMAVTETMVFKFDAGYWNSLRLIGTQAHALVYAWNWMTLLADPRCNMAVFHDLETTFFGMMRYDAGYDESAGQFVGLAEAKPEQNLRRFPCQYLLSPTSAANRLLAELVGCRVGMVTLKPDDSSLRVLWGIDSQGSRLLVAVHRSPDAKTLAVSGLNIQSAESLTADDLGSVLPDQYRVAALDFHPDRPNQIDLPPWSVTVVRLNP